MPTSPAIAALLATLLIACSARPSDSVETTSVTSKCEAAAKGSKQPDASAASDPETSMRRRLGKPVLTQHSAIVIPGTVNPEKLTLDPATGALAASDERLQVLRIDSKTGAVTARIRLFKSPTDIAFGTRANTIGVTTNDDLRLYQIAEPTAEPKLVRKHAGNFLSLAHCGQTSAAFDATDGGHLLLLDDGYQIRHRIKLDQPLRRTLACNPRRVALTGPEVQIYDADSGTRIGAFAPTYRSPKERVTALALSDDTLAAVSNEGSLWLWRIPDKPGQNGRLIAHAPRLISDTALAFHPTRPLLWAGDRLLSSTDLGHRYRWSGHREFSGRPLFSPDGRFLLRTGTYGIARFDIDGWLADPPLFGHREWTFAMDLDPTGNHLATADNGTVLLWQVPAKIANKPAIQRPRCALERHRPVFSGGIRLGFHPERPVLFTAGAGIIHAWSVPTCQLERSYTSPAWDHDDSLDHLQVGRKYLAVGSNNQVSVLDIDSGALVADLGSFSVDGFGGAVEGIALDPREQFLAVGSQGGKSAIFALPDGKLLKQLPDLESGYDVRFWLTPDGERVLRTASTGPAIIWDRSWQKLGSFKSAWIQDIEFLPDGKSYAFVTSQSSGIGRVDIDRAMAHKGEYPDTTWNVRPTADAFAVLWDQRRQLVYSQERDDGIWFWDGATGAARGRWHAESGDFVSRLQFSTDGRQLMSWQSDASMRVWDLDAYRPVANVEKARYPGAEAATALTRDILVAISKAGMYQATITSSMWNAWRRSDKYSAIPAPFDDDTSGYQVVGASADGAQAVFIDDSGEILRIDVATGAKQVIKTRLHEKHAEFVATSLSPDGKYMALATRDKAEKLHLELRDAVTGRRLHRTKTDEHEPAMWFVGEERMLVTSDKIHWWSRKTGRISPLCPAVPDLLHGNVIAVARTGRLLLEADAIRIIDTDNCQLLGAIITGAQPTRSADFSPDGQTFAIGLFGGDIALYRTDSGQRLATLRNHSATLWSSISPRGYQFANGFTAPFGE